MRKDRFESYCLRVREMEAAVPQWYGRADSLIEDYLRESTAYGFGKVLRRLLAPARAVVCGMGGEKGAALSAEDLSAAAGILSARCPVPSFRFSAYAFAVWVMAVSLGRADAERAGYEQFDEDELTAFGGEALDFGDPCRRALYRYRMRLPDFSRNNQLVHLRAAKSSALLFRAGDLAQVTERLLGGKKLYVGSWKSAGAEVLYRCRICGRIEVRAYAPDEKGAVAALPCPICDAENTRGRKSLQPLPERAAVWEGGRCACPACGAENTYAALKADGFFCSVCGKPLLPPSYPVLSGGDLRGAELYSRSGDAYTRAAVRAMTNRAASLERNFGVHVLYLTCGILHWKDRGGAAYDTPLLLCPVRFCTDKRGGGIALEAEQGADSAFELNKTLVQMLGAYAPDCAVSLPEYGGQGAGAYFALVRAALRHAGERAAGAADWEVTPDIAVGVFRYQKLQLEHDIAVHGDLYLSHPVIRRLCGDMTCPLPPAPRLSDSLEYMLLDADSSQEDVVRAAQEGRSFILQGPPGSGKSRTITNIIAVSVGEGKSVLFVTEKASARSVILENLRRLPAGDGRDLTDFVLDFDRFSRRGGVIGKVPFVREINAAVDRYAADGCGGDAGLLAQECVLRRRVQEYMSQVRAEHGGESVQRLMREAAPYAGKAGVGATVPRDRAAMAELCELVRRYFALARKGGFSPEYAKNALCGCLGDGTGDLASVAEQYARLRVAVSDIVRTLAQSGWRVGTSAQALRDCASRLQKWTLMPDLPAALLLRLDEQGTRRALERVRRRKAEAEKLAAHPGAALCRNIVEQEALNLDREAQRRAMRRYAFRPLRFGARYRAFLDAVYGCFHDRADEPCNYAGACVRMARLDEFSDWCTLRERYQEETPEDAALFGEACPQTPAEWDKLEKKLDALLGVFRSGAHTAIAPAALGGWMASFAGETRRERLRSVRSAADAISDVQEREKALAARLLQYFDPVPAARGAFPPHAVTADTVLAHRSELADWRAFAEVRRTLRRRGQEPVLDALLAAGVRTAEEAAERIAVSFYASYTDAFVQRCGLDAVAGFSRAGHEQLLQAYASAEQAVLCTGPSRLYACLSARIRRAKAAGTFRRLRAETGSSVRSIIRDGWETVRLVKPCFMMSPLNASRYIEAGLQFDLVIFDEASQIFTEDALASIVRGKQIIVAGDSKQLPPCDFFRAADVLPAQEEEEEERAEERSLLDAADRALCDSSRALSWHYRSSDEGLIAFSNEQMHYDLITFPAAVHDENDGIEFVPVRYAPDRCYRSGKGVRHINSGEADEVVRQIWKEMTHPVRRAFSIGVVAFSNAQAAEIEARWEAFRARADVAPVAEAWEREHADEPLIFCNLDTVQGDERDTVLLSVCYSRNAAGEFRLSFLGRVCFEEGKKRINVAVTRARHRMIVVSMLEASELGEAVRARAAAHADGEEGGAENRSGAEMLCAFLQYARTYRSGKPQSARSDDPLAASVCAVLDAAGIAYDTSIGRSECKISVGVRGAREGEYLLGIVIDDPARADFDSPREYARLTVHVLESKYRWNIYRIYPVAWVRDYAAEKQRLLDTVARLRAATAKVGW